MSKEGNENHKLYAARSPYYQGILRSWGRYLTASQAGAILREHSMEEDYESEHGTLKADVRIDAADLLAWMGY